MNVEVEQVFPEVMFSITEAAFLGFSHVHIGGMWDPPPACNRNSKISALCPGQGEFCLQGQLHSTASPGKAAALIKKRPNLQEPFPGSGKI